MTFGGSNNGPRSGPTGGGSGGNFGSSGGSGGVVSVAPSFGQGMGKSQLGQLFADLFAQEHPPVITSQTIPATNAVKTPGTKPVILSQQSNPVNQWGAIPIVLGEMLMTPYLSANLWMSFRVGDNNNDLFVGYCLGYGPLATAASEIHVGDILIEDLSNTNIPGRPGVAYELVLTKDDAAQDLLLYDTETALISKLLKYNEKVINRVPQDASLIMIVFEFPSGLSQQTTTITTTTTTTVDPVTFAATSSSSSSSSTVAAATSVVFKIEYRLVDATTWTVEQAAWTVTKLSTDPIFVDYELTPPAIGHYEIRIKRTTVMGDGVNIIDTCNLYSICGVLQANPPYPMLPKGADGADCVLGGLFCQVTATAQVQNNLDAITIVEASMIPVFNGNLGLAEAFYKVDDKPPANSHVILDTSGNATNGYLTIIHYYNLLPEWTRDTPHVLSFNGNTSILTANGIDAGTFATAKLQISFIPTDYNGHPNNSGSNMILNATSASGEVSLYQKHSDLYCTAGSVSLHIVGISPFGVQRRAEILMTGAAGEMDTVTLNVYDADDNLIGTATDSDTEITDSLTFYIGAMDTGPDRFFGQIFNFEEWQDGTLLIRHPIDDFVLPDVPDIITDVIKDYNGTIDDNEDGTLVVTGGGPFWTAGMPPRLIFDGANVSFTSPIGFNTNDVNIAASFIGSGAALINPIFSTGPSHLITVYQVPASGDLVFHYTGGTPLTLTLAGAAPVDTETRVILDINPNGIFPGTAGSSTHINLRTVDTFGATIANVAGDIDTGIGGDAAISGTEIDFGISHFDFFTGRIWNVNIFSQGAMFGNPGYSANPALECLYLMRSPSFNPKPVPDNLIDFPGFYAWSKHCAQLGYEFHAIIDQPVILWNLLQDVAKAGRAKIVKRNGLYSPAMDLSRLRTGQLPSQSFTPFNSSGFKYRNTKSQKFHAVRVNYLDTFNKYLQAQVIVYNAGFDATNAKHFAPVENYYGCKSKSLAQLYGRHVLADLELRSKEYELVTDWEGLVCAVGDHVFVSHDAALIGTASGSIISKNITGGVVVSITIDQGAVFEAGKTYAVRLRDSHLNSITAVLTNPGAGLYYTLTFANTILETDFDLVIPGDQFQFGEQDLESKLMIIKLIDRLPDHGSRLVLCDYAEGVYEFEADYSAGITAYTTTARVAPQL